VRCAASPVRALERPRDNRRLLINLQPRAACFSQSMRSHRLTGWPEELLYPAMGGNYRLDLTVGRAATARTRSVPVRRSRPGGQHTPGPAALSSPLRDRFRPDPAAGVLWSRRSPGDVEAGRRPASIWSWDAEAAAEVAAVAAARRVSPIACLAPGCAMWPRARPNPSIGPALGGRKRQPCIGSTTGALMPATRRLLELAAHGLWRRAGGPRHAWLPGLGGSDHPGNVVEYPIVATGFFCCAHCPHVVGGHAGARQHSACRRRPEGWLLACCSPPAGLSQPVSISALNAPPRGPLGDALPLWDRVLGSRPPTTLRPGSNRGIRAVGAWHALSGYCRSGQSDGAWSQGQPRSPSQTAGIAEEGPRQWELAEPITGWVLARVPLRPPPSYNLAMCRDRCKQLGRRRPLL